MLEVLASPPVVTVKHSLNVEQLVFTVGSLVASLAILGSPVIKLFRNLNNSIAGLGKSIGDQDSRIAKLEGIAEGRRQVLAERLVKEES